MKYEVIISGVGAFKVTVTAKTEEEAAEKAEAIFEGADLGALDYFEARNTDVIEQAITTPHYWLDLFVIVGHVYRDDYCLYRKTEDGDEEVCRGNLPKDCEDWQDYLDNLFQERYGIDPLDLEIG